MSFLRIKNIKVAGISACVPETIVRNTNSVVNNVHYDAESFVKSTGVAQRHMSEELTTSDLCYKATNKLLDDLGWERESIDVMLFVSQSQDFILPATSCILQDRLKLSKNCFCEDISLGCSGWTYGMATLASLMSSGEMKRGLLLAGDAKKHYPADDPLFGYAGTATAIEYVEGERGFYFNFGTDGSGYADIIVPEGGSRNPLSPDSFRKETVDGKEYSRLETRMKGMNVFLFATSKVPLSVKHLYEHYKLDLNSIDYLVLHQSNLKILNLIQRILKLPKEKVPTCLDEFGNTSSASIPMTIVSRLSEKLNGNKKDITCCGYGVGLSWATLNMQVSNIKIPKVIFMANEEKDMNHLA